MIDPAIHKGLAGVVVDTTEISMVDEASNSLTYRGTPFRTWPPRARSRRWLTCSGMESCPLRPS